MERNYELFEDFRLVWSSVRSVVSGEEVPSGLQGDTTRFAGRPAELPSGKQNGQQGSPGQFKKCCIPKFEHGLTKLSVLLSTFKGKIVNLFDSKELSSALRLSYLDFCEVMHHFLLLYTGSGRSECARKSLIEAGDALADALTAVEDAVKEDVALGACSRDSPHSSVNSSLGRLLFSVKSMHRLPETVDGFVRRRLLGSIRLLKDVERELQVDEITEKNASSGTSSGPQDDEDVLDMDCSIADPRVQDNLLIFIRGLIALLKEAVLMVVRYGAAATADQEDRRVRILDRLAGYIDTLTATVDACCVGIYTEDVDAVVQSIGSLELISLKGIQECFEELQSVWKQADIASFHQRKADIVKDLRNLAAVVRSSPHTTSNLASCVSVSAK